RPGFSTHLAAAPSRGRTRILQQQKLCCAAADGGGALYVWTLRRMCWFGARSPHRLVEYLRRHGTRLRFGSISTKARLRALARYRQTDHANEGEPCQDLYYTYYRSHRHDPLLITNVHHPGQKNGRYDSPMPGRESR